MIINIKSKKAFSILDHKILNKIQFEKNSKEVFVYIIDIANSVPNLEIFWNCLVNQEKMRAKQYRNQNSTNQYIIAHGILRYILSFYNEKHPSNIEFAYNNYGKIFLKNANVYFNLSYSPSIICCAVSLNHEIGIDIELKNNNFDIRQLYHLILTPAETEYIYNFNLNKQCDIFYRFWTKKEALVKAIGLGLSYPVNTIDTINLLYSTKISLNNKNPDFLKEFYCYTLEEIPWNHSGALAVSTKVDKITYLKMSNKKGIFDEIKCIQLD